ncbi:MAG: EAL domain-containing protein [Gammaproteobacteria bacterium]|nr:EAL domain-containing protein [Gammaproteobacteria bacterium]MBU1645044.1 EAL domain-containing protein [Gammaproteobacteria bacterium]MBU1973281.1 EAL domain-containing protein [Gammaproteobacteria bacterium]
MSEEVLFGRQPIVNDRLELVGYELLFRDPDNFRHAVVADHAHATATVITHAFSQFSIASALGDCLGYINVDKDFLNDDAIELLPADKVVLEVLEHGEITPEVIARCRELKQRGYTLALDDLIHCGDSMRLMLDVVSVVKVDLALVGDEKLPDLVGQLRGLPIKLLAEKVETREQMERCRELGFHLFQGYFFAKPVVVTGRKLSPAQATLLRLLNLLAEDAETGAIETAFKLEPALTLNLLRLTNSVAIGARNRIGSIHAAITILGRRQLQRWLQLLLYADSDAAGVGHNPMLMLAATRGRFMELLAMRLHPKDRALADLAFMTGIMSLMPAVFGMAMADILEQLAVVPEVKRALLEHAGEVGVLLGLAESSESSTMEGVAELMDQLPQLTATILSTCLAEALVWVQQLDQAKE